MEKQLTLPGFEPKKKIYPLTIFDKTNFVLKNMKEKMPDLYNELMKGKTK